MNSKLKIYLKEDAFLDVRHLPKNNKLEDIYKIKKIRLLKLNKETEIKLSSQFGAADEVIGLTIDGTNHEFYDDVYLQLQESQLEELAFSILKYKSQGYSAHQKAQLINKVGQFINE
jgi:hypothetical protein